MQFSTDCISFSNYLKHSFLLYSMAGSLDGFRAVQSGRKNPKPTSILFHHREWEIAYHGFCWTSRTIERVVCLWSVDLSMCPFSLHVWKWYVKKHSRLSQKLYFKWSQIEDTGRETTSLKPDNLKNPSGGKPRQFEISKIKFRHFQVWLQPSLWSACSIPFKAEENSVF